MTANARIDEGDRRLLIVDDDEPFRKKLEKMYAEYETDRRTDMRRFDTASPHEAWELMRTIERKERALEAIDRWLSGWSRPGIGETAIAPPAGVPSGRAR